MVGGLPPPLFFFSPVPPSDRSPSLTIPRKPPVENPAPDHKSWVFCVLSNPSFSAGRCPSLQGRKSLPFGAAGIVGMVLHESWRDRLNLEKNRGFYTGLRRERRCALSFSMCSVDNFFFRRAPIARIADFTKAVFLGENRKIASVSPSK